MESQTEYLERCRAAFKIKSDAHIARQIGVSPQTLHKFKHGEKQLGKEVMLTLANRSGLDPNEALVLRALWAAQIETIPNYASYLIKFAGCFLACLVFSANFFAYQDKPLKTLDNLPQKSTENADVINIMRVSWKLLRLCFQWLAQCLHGLPYGLLQFSRYDFAHQFETGL